MFGAFALPSTGLTAGSFAAEGTQTTHAKNGNTNSSSFLNGLGNVVGGAVEAGGNFLNGLFQLKLAEKIGGLNSSQAQNQAATATAQAAAAKAQAEAAIATSKAQSSTLIPGVPNLVVYSAAAVFILAALFMFGKK